MPTTQELITTIKEDFAPDWSRTRLLGYLDWAHRTLVCQDCAQSIFLNSGDDNFPIPILQTTTGSLEYEVVAGNFADSDGDAVTFTVDEKTVIPRRVKNVFIQASSTAGSDFNRRFYLDSFSWSGINDNWSRRIYQVSYWKVPCHLFDKTNDRGPVIQFVEDPGTTTDKYYVEFYFEPPELTSESVTLMVDASKWEQALIDGVVGRIEKVKNGRSEMYDRFMTYWRFAYMRSMNLNIEHRTPYVIQAREVG